MKSDISKRLVSDETIPQKEGKSALILEMSPIVYHCVMKLSHGYDRVDFIFDRNYDRNLKSGTRNNRETGSMFVFEGDDTRNDMEQTSMKESRNKTELRQYLAKKLIELYKGPQLLVDSLKDSVLCSFDCEPLHHSVISITLGTPDSMQKKQAS